jgi:hypothetical protein
MDKDLSIVQGDDYAAADGRALLFTSAGENWPDLASATLALKFIEPVAETAALSVTATRTVVGSVQHITAPLTAAQTQPLSAGTNVYDYALQATLSGRRITLKTGKVTVVGGIA